MIGLGTVINTSAITAGGLLGMKFKKILKQTIQESLLKASGLAVLFIGLSGGLKGFQTKEDLSMMIILSLVLGTLIGEFIDIEGRLNQFGKWLKQKSHSYGDSMFLDAFITTSLTVCIGAMAIIGSIQDALYQDYSILIAKAILDFIIVMVLASSMGKGALFSFVPVFIFQDCITLLASFISPLLTKQVIFNISVLGSMLIFVVGLNLTVNTKIKVANMLPSILIVALFVLL